MGFIAICISVTALFIADLYAGTPVVKKTLIAYRAEPAPPKIDGDLTDPCWMSISWDNRFIQMNPIEREKPTERTNIKAVYDDKNIYFAIYCSDSKPSAIESRLGRRDAIENTDMILIAIDSYNDKQTAFIFALSPAGTKMDAIMAKDGDEEDYSWDPVWEGKTVITKSGWAAEMRIPFSQLRFADKKEQKWGFQAYRKIHRKQEELVWQYFPKDAPGMVSNFGRLEGITDIKSPMRLELLPYGVGKVDMYPSEAGNPFADGFDPSVNVGLDGKVGLTGNLTMDFTFNPDFGQVEADPSVVNLSAFETFYEEKRPFFIEGKDIFNFPLSEEGNEGDFANEQLFYSRRIGRPPSYNPQFSSDFPSDYVHMPTWSRIIGAAKLSGKTGNGWSIGILDAVTNKESAEIEYQGQRRDVTVEPLTNYMVARVQKDFNNRDSYVGGMVTAVNRKIDDPHLQYLPGSANTIGFNLRHQWNKRSYYLDLKLAGSYLTGNQRSITRVQTSSARYFQRPDADYLSLDTTRTSIAGTGGSFTIGRHGTGNWLYGIGAIWRSPGLELNDLGYLRKADRVQQYSWLTYRRLNPVGIFLRYDIGMVQWLGWNFGGDRLVNGGLLRGGVKFSNYWGFRLGLRREQNGLSPDLLRGGPMARIEGLWNPWLVIYSDTRRDGYIQLFHQSTISDDDISRSDLTNLTFYYKVTDKVNISLSPFYSANKTNLQWLSENRINNEPRYIFGLIDQTTAGLTFRLNYSPTPELSVQYFGQPFISAGAYTQFKYFTNPRAQGARRYDIYDTGQITYDAEGNTYYIDENKDGQPDYSFSNPDFNIQEFLSNFVIRWEYMPGSTLYIVWSQVRNNVSTNGTFLLGPDLRNLFSSGSYDVFLIKMNYWFSF